MSSRTHNRIAGKICYTLLRPVSLACLGAALLCAMPLHAETTAETLPAGEPHLVFKKSVVVKHYSEGRAHAEEHVVRKGEHLWQILRRQYGMSDASINFFCKIAQAVNPDIEDLNVLRPDQNILLPFKYVPGDGSDNRTLMIDTQDCRHEVRPGEHFGQILRSRFGLPDTVIFSRITKSLLSEANPGIDDLNTISPGQTVIIPREVFAMHQIVEQGVMAGEDLLPEGESQAGSEPPDAPALPMDASADAPAMRFTEEPLSDEEQEIKQMLSSMTRQFDGTDNSTGEDVIAGTDTTLRLDYSRFPAYNFPWGKKVVLDYGGRLNEEERGVIAGHWKNAEVVSVQARDDIETIIGRVLDVCGFYKVEKDASYTVNRDAIQLSVTGNWIVFRDSGLRNVFVVNLARDGRPSISPSLKSYLSGIGLDVMDIGAYADSAAGEPQRAALKSTESAPAALTDTILDMLGIEFRRDYRTNIFQNIYSGLSLEVVADRMFSRNGQSHLIDFSGLPVRITGIITQQGFKLLQIAPSGETPDATAGRLLEFCSADFQPPPATLVFDGNERENVRLTVPGYVVQTPAGRCLLTGSAINASISDFLREMNIRIIAYH